MRRKDRLEKQKNAAAFANSCIRTALQELSLAKWHALRANDYRTELALDILFMGISKIYVEGKK